MAGEYLLNPVLPYSRKEREPPPLRAAVGPSPWSVPSGF